jgi:hypothetical protein
MIDIKKLVLVILSSFGISGLLSSVGIVLIGLNWNSNFSIFNLSVYTCNIIINVFLIVLLVVYCVFILIHTKGKYAEVMIEKIEPLANKETCETRSSEARANVSQRNSVEIINDKLSIKRPRKNSIVVRPCDDGAVEIKIEEL